MPNKLYEQCKKCKYKDDCDEKRMVACAYMRNEPMLADASAEIAAPVMQPIIVKHDYRNIKVGENTTITIDLVDLEELKRQLERERFQSLIRHA